MTTAFSMKLRERQAASDHAALLAELAAERDEAIAELVEHDSRLAEVTAEHDAKVAAAMAAVNTARAALDQAQAAARDAEAQRRTARGLVEIPRERLRARLEGELLDPAIAEAVAQLESLAEDARRTAETLDAREFIGTATERRRMTEANAKIHAALTARLRWINDTGRPSLMELRYVAGDDIESAIEDLFAGLPVIEQ
jgi:hypothetical protein